MNTNPFAVAMGAVKPTAQHIAGRVHVIADSDMPKRLHGRIPVFTPDEIRALAKALSAPPAILTEAGGRAVRGLRGTRERPALAVKTGEKQ